MKFLFILISILTLSLCELSHAQTYIKGPALIEGFTETATSAGLTILTKDSQTNQVFTGATTHTIQLPVSNTLPEGRYFVINNRSSDVLTVTDNGTNTLGTLAPNSQKKFLITDNSGMDGSWDISESGAITNTPNKFAYFDSLGHLEDLSGWTANSNGGVDAFNAITPADIGSAFAGAYNFQLNVTPTGPITDSYYGMYSDLTFAGADDFENLYGAYTYVGATSSGTGNLLYGHNINMFIDDVTTLGDVYGVQAYTNIEGAVTNVVRGFESNLSVQAGASVSNITSFSTNPQIDDTVATATMFNSNGYGAGHVTNFTGMGMIPNFTTDSFTGVNLGIGADTTNFQGMKMGIGSSGDNFTAVNTNLASGENFDNVTILNGNFGTDGAASFYNGIFLSPQTDYDAFNGISIQPSGDGDNFTGINVSPTGTYASGLTGVSIDMSAATNSSSSVNRMTALQIQGGTFNQYADTRTVDSIFVDSANTMGPTLIIDSGTPITGTTFFGNNFANVYTINDDFAAGPLGSSAAAVAYVGLANIAAGKTMGGLSMAVSGGNISGPGALTELTLYDAIGGIDGGAADVETLTGFRMTNNLGLVPTEIFGLYIDVDTAENYLGKSLAIDTTSHKVSAANYGLEIGNGKDALVEGDVQIGDALKIEEAGGADTVTVTAPALAAAYSLVLPADDGNAGQFLQSDGSGNLTWATDSGGELNDDDLTLTASDTIAISLTDIKQTWLVASASGDISLSSTPFGATDPNDGTEITLIGNDDALSVEIPVNDAANGVIGFVVVLYRGDVVTYKYNATLDRYVIKSTNK